MKHRNTLTVLIPAVLLLAPLAVLHAGEPLPGTKEDWNGGAFHGDVVVGDPNDDTAIVGGDDYACLQ